MSINVRTKGAQGERDVCILLNAICQQLEDEGVNVGYNDEAPKFQRNQNQSAVGGSDITNPYGLSIEVKRQENLSINTWWNQCLAASEQDGGIPILIFRQNGKKWRIIMNVYLPVTETRYHHVRAEMDIDTFKQWAKDYIKSKHED